MADGESQIDPENSPEVESSSSTSPLAFVKVFVLFTVWQVTAVVNGMCCNQTDLQTAVNDWYANTTTATATYGDISEWSVTAGSMAWTIANKGAFDGDITFWDASSVNNLSHSFASAHAFNQPLNVWDTSVTNLDDTFDKQFAKTKLAESAKSAKRAKESKPLDPDDDEDDEESPSDSSSDSSDSRQSDVARTETKSDVSYSDSSSDVLVFYEEFRKPSRTSSTVSTSLPQSSHSSSPSPLSLSPRPSAREESIAVQGLPQVWNLRQCGQNDESLPDRSSQKEC